MSLNTQRLTKERKEDTNIGRVKLWNRNVCAVTG